MDTRQLIASYIDEVALRLPRDMRSDVGFELEELLTEELAAAARAAGRAPDEALAMELLQRFGRPDDVAARYRPAGFELIEPGLAPLYVRLSLVLVGIQWALTLPAVFSGTKPVGDWWLGWGLGALWWPGMLVAYFAGATWIRRRWPVDPVTGVRPWTHWILWLPMGGDWPPVDRQQRLQDVAKGVVPLSALVTVIFVLPVFLASILPDDIDVSWARYDADFERWLLAPLMAIIVARLALVALVARDTRWIARTALPRFALRLGFVALLVWALFGWAIFATPGVNALFKAWLSIFVLVNVIQMAVDARRAFLRLRAPLELARR